MSTTITLTYVKSQSPRRKRSISTGLFSQSKRRRVPVHGRSHSTPEGNDSRQFANDKSKINRKKSAPDLKRIQVEHPNKKLQEYFSIASIAPEERCVTIDIQHESSIMCASKHYGVVNSGPALSPSSNQNVTTPAVNNRRTTCSNRGASVSNHCKLFNWLQEFATSIEINSITTSYSLKLLVKLFHNLNNFPAANLQAVGIASMWIASKLFETQKKQDTLLSSALCIIKKEELVEMEQILLNALSYNLCFGEFK